MAIVVLMVGMVRRFDVELMLMVLQLGSVLVLVTVYWVPALLYTTVDLFMPSVLYKYKVPPSQLNNAPSGPRL